MVTRAWTVACLLSLLCTAAASANVRTFVDPKALDETETLRLTLRLEGSRSAEAPDLSGLDADFEVLGNSSSSQYRSINGQVQSWVEYQITLRPRRTGTLTIPALDLGGFKSDPTTIEVRALDPVLRQEIDRMVFFETEVSPNPVYVQAELIFVRRLFYSTSGGVQMYSDLPGAPELEDAVVIPLEDARSYSERRNDIDYGVVEQRFAIYPERSGTITIPPVALTSSVRVLKNGRMRRSGIRVASEPVSVEVLPIPSEYPAAAPWLPATRVTLTQTIDPRSGIETGTPFIHTVRIEVQGNVSSAITPVASSDDAELRNALRAYPEAPVTTDQVRSGTNVGKREQRTSLLPVQPGSIALPALEIAWWDTAASVVRTSRTGAIALDIRGTAVANDAAELDAAGTADANREPQTGSADNNAPLVTTIDPLSRWPLLLPLLLIPLGVVGWRQRHRGARWWRQRRSAATARAPRRASHPRRAASRARRDLQQQLQRSAGEAPAQAAQRRRTALIQAVADATRTDSVRAIALIRQERQGTKVLQALNAQCYGSGARVPSPSDAAIEQAFTQALGSAAAGEGAQAQPALPPLYPPSA